MSSDEVVQVVEESGDFSDAPDSFAEDADFVVEVLAVLGPQASEKSTPRNAALGTAYAVAARGAPEAQAPEASPPQSPADAPPYSHSTSGAATPAPANARSAHSRRTAPASRPRFAASIPAPNVLNQ
jgi:hypothetical protein